MNPTRPAAAEQPPVEATEGTVPGGGGHESNGPALRRWFYPYVAFLAALLIAQWLGLIPLAYSWLTAYFVYMALACTFLPLPTAWVVMLMTAPWHPLLGWHPLVVAGLGTVGTGLANLQDYHVLTYLLQRRRIGAVRTKRWYKRAEAWFYRAPFATLAAASFLPIPVDVVRLLAIGGRYPRPRFVLASVVGRVPRYVLLAYLGAQPFMTLRTILLILAATIILGLSRGLPRLIQQVRATRGRAAP